MFAFETHHSEAVILKLYLASKLTGGLKSIKHRVSDSAGLE